MIQKSTQNEREFQLSIPWDSNTFRGFVVGVVLMAILILIAPLVDLRVQSRIIEQNTIPIELLQFGKGNDNKPSRGNLTAEGAALRGKESTESLKDAQAVDKSKVLAKNHTEYTPDSHVKPVRETPVQTISKEAPPATATVGSENVGVTKGDKMGSGLGDFGGGKGLGEGYGLEWGGGGNRQVLQKILPTYPPGVNTSAQIRIRFTVTPEGNVGTPMLLQKGEPQLERAALEALRKWRFNPLKTDKDMVGIITFTFKVR